MYEARREEFPTGALLALLGIGVGTLTWLAWPSSAKPAIRAAAGPGSSVSRAQASDASTHSTPQPDTPQPLAVALPSWFPRAVPDRFLGAGLTLAPLS